MMDVNSTSIFIGMKLVNIVMRNISRGYIINISSIYDLVGEKHNVAYHASKRSVRLATKGAALQYANGNILVYLVHSGMVTTPMPQRVN